MKEQRPREAVLETSGRMCTLVLEVKWDSREGGEVEPDQMGVGRSPVVGFDPADRVYQP